MAHRDTLLAGVAGAAPDETLDRRLTKALLIALADKLGVFDGDGNIQGVEQHQITPQAMIGGRRLRAYMGHGPVEIRRMAGSDEEAEKVYTALGITPEAAEAAFRDHDRQERDRRRLEREAARMTLEAGGDEEPQAPAPEAAESTALGSTTTATDEEVAATSGLARFRAAMAAKGAQEAAPPATATAETSGGQGGDQDPPTPPADPAAGGAEITTAVAPDPATPPATDPKAEKAPAKAPAKS